jgi:hypothetical protein
MLVNRRIKQIQYNIGFDKYINYDYFKISNLAFFFILSLAIATLEYNARNTRQSVPIFNWKILQNKYHNK